MSAERRKVLEMLAAGKITAEEADRLLERLASATGPDRGPAAGAASPADGGEGAGRPRVPRFLRVVVDSPDRDGIDIRLPLGLVRTGLKLPALLPGRVSRRLSERGIDLAHLSGLDDETLIAELSALHVDLSAEDGERVRVFCD
jgi:hypothetical protein